MIVVSTGRTEQLFTDLVRLATEHTKRLLSSNCLGLIRVIRTQNGQLLFVLKTSPGSSTRIVIFLTTLRIYTRNGGTVTPAVAAFLRKSIKDSLVDRQETSIYTCSHAF